MKIVVGAAMICFTLMLDFAILYTIGSAIETIAQYSEQLVSK